MREDNATRQGENRRNRRKSDIFHLVRRFSFVSYFLFLSYQSYYSSPMPDGAALFTANCAKCHGQDGRGIPKYLKKGQKDFTDVKWQKSRTDAQLTKVIADGKGEYMPPWKDKFSPEEIKGLVGKIRDFGKEK
jgi:cytochrome c oxidase cbb3-type subunit 3